MLEDDDYSACNSLPLLVRTRKKEKKVLKKTAFDERKMNIAKEESCVTPLESRIR